MRKSLTAGEYDLPGFEFGMADRKGTHRAEQAKRKGKGGKTVSLMSRQYLEKPAE